LDRGAGASFAPNRLSSARDPRSSRVRLCSGSDWALEGYEAAFLHGDAAGYEVLVYLEGRRMSPVPPRSQWREPPPRTRASELLAELILTSFRLHEGLMAVAQKLGPKAG
jgi:hypothetical protein